MSKLSNTVTKYFKKSTKRRKDLLRVMVSEVLLLDQDEAEYHGGEGLMEMLIL